MLLNFILSDLFPEIDMLFALFFHTLSMKSVHVNFKKKEVRGGERKTKIKMKDKGELGEDRKVEEDSSIFFLFTLQGCCSINQTLVD